MKRNTHHIIYTVLFSILLTTSGAMASTGRSDDGSSRSYHLADHYLVTYNGSEAAFRFQMRTLGCSVDAVWSAINVARISGVVPSDIAVLHETAQIGDFARDVSVNWVNTLSADLNVRVQAAAEATAAVTPADAEFYEVQWGLQQIDVVDAWKVTRGDRSVRVGILDTGISPDHVDLKGRYDLDASINLSSSNPEDSRDVIDRHYHGTHVSALIASNNLGVASVAPEVTLVGVKVLDDKGYASFANLIAGVMYAVDVADVDIINLSVGGTGNIEEVEILSEMLHAAVDYAERNGVIVVAAAGNETMDLRTEASHNFVVTDEAGTILVSATAPSMEPGSESIACYSNYGSGIVGLAAPGGSIDCADGAFASMSDMVLSAMAPAVARRLGLKNPEGWYMFSAGTSMAAPIVSGVAALVKSANPGMDAAGVCEKLKASADDLGTPGPDQQFGSGRVNAASAVR